MLTYGVDDDLTQFMFFSDFNAIFDMRDEDQAGHGWRKLVVFILSDGLIFDKIERLSDLSDVMVVAANFCQQRIGSYFRCCRFNHRSDDDRVMIRARSLNHESSENGSIQVGQLQKGNIGGITESDFHKRRDARGEDTGNNTPDEGKSPIPEQFKSHKIG